MLAALPPASESGTILTRLPSRTTAAFDNRNALSKAGSRSLRGMAPTEASVTLPCTRGSTRTLSLRTSPRSVLATVRISAPSKFISTPWPTMTAPGWIDATRVYSFCSRCGSGSFSAPGKMSGCDGSRWFEVTLSEVGKRGVRSRSRTCSPTPGPAADILRSDFVASSAAQPSSAQSIVPRMHACVIPRANRACVSLTRVPLALRHPKSSRRLPRFLPVGSINHERTTPLLLAALPANAPHYLVDGEHSAAIKRCFAAKQRQFWTLWKSLQIAENNFRYTYAYEEPMLFV